MVARMLRVAELHSLFEQDVVVGVASCLDDELAETPANFLRIVPEEVEEIADAATILPTMAKN